MNRGITRDTAKDVMRISGTPALIAARFCNFKTAESFLLASHIDFLDNEVRPVVRTTPNCWIDMFGYASRAGNADYNMRLSEARIKSVRSLVDQYKDNIRFSIFKPLGETDSGSVERNDDGYYRAVEIYVYGQKPNPSPIPPKPKPMVRRFVKRVFSKFDTKGDIPSRPSESEDINEILRFGIKALSGKLTAEALLGTESKTGGSISEINSGHQVIKVTIDQSVEYSSFVGGSTTSMDTVITYDWGPPTMLVTVENRYQATIMNEKRPPERSIHLVLRSQTYGNPVLIPPDP